MKLSLLPVSFLTASSFVLLTACSVGGSDEEDTNTAEPITNQTGSPVEEAATTTGRFVDSAVMGMAYQTPSQQGVTDADGTFSYTSGEDVVFSIGSIELPAVAGAALITPFTVFETDQFDDPRVINLTRLLQTLDVDANPENGITISDAAALSATGLEVDFASDEFDATVSNLVANSGSTNATLIDGETALTHFQETLFIEGVMERPQAPSATDTPSETNPEASATHPLVGTVHEFSTRAHDVSGTVTILNDNIIEVSNFVYDGEGPSVFFYTGTDGDYSSEGVGRIIGNQLNGRSYSNETITLTLPDDLTLDDFNGISVWCDIFLVSFGDVTF